jgi:hypothetical protein
MYSTHDVEMIFYIYAEHLSINIEMAFGKKKSMREALQFFEL